MELQSPDGSTIPIDRASGTVIGRGLGFGLRPSSADRTISRRHLSLRLPFPAGSADENDDPGAGSRVSFEVIGKNPILICRSSGGCKMVYRRSEKGQLETGDLISLSLKNPYFFALKRMEGEGAAVDQKVLDAVERREKRTLQRRKEKEEEKEKEKEKRGTEDVSIGEVGNDEAVGELEIELGSLDVSQIDPVEVFGFLVKGREFDQYPRQKIRAVKDWNWFLEEPRRSSDDEDDEVMDEATTSKAKGRRRSKKKGGDNEDEEWTGESEGEKELAMGAGSSKRPRYTTRLKDSKKLHKDTSGGRKPAVQKGAKSLKVEFEEEDEEDETLGGFVVDDEGEEAEGDEEDEEQEEEELEDEEESDDD